MLIRILRARTSSLVQEELVTIEQNEESKPEKCIGELKMNILAIGERYNRSCEARIP